MEYGSDVPVSMPVFDINEDEEIPMNGFAFCQAKGIVISSTPVFEVGVVFEDSNG